MKASTGLGAVPTNALAHHSSSSPPRSRLTMDLNEAGSVLQDEQMQVRAGM